jgi:hypothetical protein
MPSAIPLAEPVRADSSGSELPLDVEREPDLEDLVRLVSDLCDVPTSMVTLLDSDRRSYQETATASPYARPEEAPVRQTSLDEHAVVGRDLMVVPDAAADSRFADYPDVRSGAGIRFYAAAPLATADGIPLGTLCVTDRRPRRLTLAQVRALRALSRQVAEHLELRRYGDEPGGGEALSDSHRAVDLSYLLDGRVDDLRSIADVKGIPVTVIRGGSALVDADPRRLAQVLDYILLTALKGASAGRVATTVTAAPHPTVTLRSASQTPPRWVNALTRRPVRSVPAAVGAVLRAHGATASAAGEEVRLDFPAVHASDATTDGQLKRRQGGLVTPAS